MQRENTFFWINSIFFISFDNVLWSKNHSLIRPLTENARRALCAGPLLNPFHQILHICVHARVSWSGTSFAITDYSCQVKLATFLTHQRASTISLARIDLSFCVSSADFQRFTGGSHVVRLLTHRHSDQTDVCFHKGSSLWATLFDSSKTSNSAHFASFEVGVAAWKTNWFHVVIEFHLPF